MDEYEQIAAMEKAEEAVLVDSNFPEIITTGELLECGGGKLGNVLNGLENLHDFGPLSAIPLCLADIVGDRASSIVSLEQLYPPNHNLRLKSGVKNVKDHN